MDKKNNYCVVHSAYGDIKIDKDGVPFDIKFNDTNYKGCYIEDIKKFDLDEYKNHYGSNDSEYDILDIGYWAKHGYIKPDKQFRIHTANLESQQIGDNHEQSP